MEIGILIVDDEEDIRLLIRALIEAANEGLSVRGEASDGTEAIDKADALDPTVIVLDQRMPGLTGLEAADEILRRHPKQRIVLCSAYLDAELRARAAEVGITLCLSKGDAREIPSAVREAALGLAG